MKTLISLFILILFISEVNGQIDKYPKGVYITFDEVKIKSPSQQIPLVVSKRTKSDIKMSGGNDYKIESEDKAINKNTVKKEFIAYSQGDTL